MHVKPKPINEAWNSNNEELNSKMMGELSISRNDDDEDDYQSHIKSTKRGSDTKNKKENNSLVTSLKTKEVYQVPSKRVDSKEKEPSKERALSSGKRKKESKKTSRK